MAENFRILLEGCRVARERVVPVLFEEKTLRAVARRAGVELSEILASAHERSWFEEVVREAWIRSRDGMRPAPPVIELVAERDRELGRLLRHARGRQRVSSEMIRVSRAIARIELLLTLPPEYWSETGRVRELASRPAPKRSRNPPLGAHSIGTGLRSPGALVPRCPGRGRRPTSR